MRPSGYAAFSASTSTFTNACVGAFVGAFVRASIGALLGSALSGCAHMEAPPGGPADTKRPYVSAVLPAPDSTRVSRDLHAQIAFSEWVNPDVERGKVYLNPPLPHKLKSKLTGNVLTITSAARLDTGTTYTLGLLGSVKDLNGLALESPMELVFSTGARLDSGHVSGRVAPFQAKASAGSFAALYPRGAELRARFLHLTHPSNRGDSVVTPEPQPNAAKEKPAYLAPADSLGRFAFKSVRPGRYALLGFQDINGNLNPEVGVEALAIGPTVEATSAGEVKTLSLFAYDTVPLKMMDAKWVGELVRGPLSEGSVRLKFSRPPHPLQSLRPEAYAVRKLGPAAAPDSGKPVQILDVCVNPSTGEVELHTEPLALDSQFVALCVGLKDAYGNAMDTARSKAAFRVTRAADTSKPDMTFFGPRKVNGDQEKIGPEKLIPSRGLAAYYPRLLSDSTLGDLKSRLVIKADTAAIPFQVLRANHHEFALRFPGLPLKGQRLQIGFKPSAAEQAAAVKKSPGPDSASPGMVNVPSATKDSLKAGPPPAAPAPVTVASYVLADTAKLGTLKFKQVASAFGSRLVLRSLSSPAEYGRQTPPTEEFLVDSLPEGWYAVDYFRDANGDGIWNPGSLAPWSVQEPYVQWADSVEVKAGAVGDGNGPARPASMNAPAPGTGTAAIDATAAAKVPPGKTEPGALAPGISAPGMTVPKATGGDRRLAWPPAW